LGKSGARTDVRTDVIGGDVMGGMRAVKFKPELYSWHPSLALPTSIGIKVGKKGAPRSMPEGVSSAGMDVP